jgi:trimeric autotransporter adhesin
VNPVVILTEILQQKPSLIQSPMKKIYVSLSATLSLVFSTSFSQSITLGSLGTTSFCPSGTLAVPFTTTLPAGTQYNVYLSNASGSFTSQTLIGTGTTSPINATFPSNVVSGTGYLIKIVSVSSINTSNFSDALTTNGQIMTISVKNLVGKEINGGSICQNSALTGIISSNQSGTTYEWKKDGVSQTTNSLLRITQTGNYIASVQKTGCNNTSKSMSINFVTRASFIALRVGDSEYQCNGNSIIIRSNYYSDNASYVWRKDKNILVGETKDTIVTNQSGNYSVDITDNCIISESVANSNYARVIFSNSLDNTLNSSDQVLCGSNTYGGLSSVLGVFPQNPLAPYSFQWKKDGINIPNATQFNLSNIQSSGIYSLEVKQGNCVSISNGVKFTKVDTLKLGLKMSYPYREKTCTGEFTRLEVTAPDGINLLYYKNGITFNPTGYLYTNVTETGNYTVTGTASGCIVMPPSDTIKITIGNKIKPTIFTNDNDDIICNGKSIRISVWNTFSFSNPTREWFRNGQSFPNSNPYQLEGVTQSGFYQLKLTSGNCSGFSDSLEIKFVSQLPKPKITNYLNNEFSSCSGNLSKLSINVRGNNNVSGITPYDSIFLKQSGQVILKRIGYEDLYINQPGTYTVLGRQGTCETESDPLVLKMGEPITANIAGSASIYAGQSANLNLNFTGSNAWSYKTSDLVTEQNTIISPLQKSVSPTITTTYTLTSVASNCGVGTISGLAKITVCNIGQSVSSQSGDWSMPSTWACGQIPTPTLDTIIEQGHTVSLPNGYQGNAKKLELKGNLTQGAGASVRVN